MQYSVTIIIHQVNCNNIKDESTWNTVKVSKTKLSPQKEREHNCDASAKSEYIERNTVQKCT